MAAERKEQGFVFTGWHMLGVMVLFFGTTVSSFGPQSDVVAFMKRIGSFGIGMPDSAAWSL